MLSINTFQIFHKTLSSNFRLCKEERQKNTREKLNCVFYLLLAAHQQNRVYYVYI
jgi:hypothetical protein